MEIYLVRHTETICEKGICYGQSDVGIRAPYDEIFESILEQLPSQGVMFTSPLQRCSILAQHIEKSKNILIVAEDPRLKEMHFGDWELKAWNAIPRTVLDPWMNDFVTVAVPNGESFLDLDQRVWEFLQEQIQKKHDQPLILVTHSGVIRSVLCRVNAIPLKDAFITPLDYGVVVKVDFPL